MVYAVKNVKESTFNLANMLGEKILAKNLNDEIKYAFHEKNLKRIVIMLNKHVIYIKIPNLLYEIVLYL